MTHAVNAAYSGAPGVPLASPESISDDESLLHRSRTILAGIVAELQLPVVARHYDELFRRFAIAQRETTTRLARLVRVDSASMLTFSVGLAVVSYRNPAEAVLVLGAAFVACFVTARFPSPRAEIRTRHAAADTLAAWVFLIGGALLAWRPLPLGTAGGPPSFPVPDGSATLVLLGSLLPVLLFFSAARVFVMSAAYRWGARRLARRDRELTAGAVLVSLAHVVVLLHDPDVLTKGFAVARVTRRLREAERLLAEELWRYVPLGVGREHARARCVDAARALAVQRERLGWPQRASRLAARDVVAQTMLALTQAHYDELPSGPAPRSVLRTVAVRAWYVVRTLLSAVLPAAVLAVADAKYPDLPTAVWAGAGAVAFGWFTLCLLTLVDPDLDRRLGRLRSFVGFFGASDDQK